MSAERARKLREWQDNLFKSKDEGAASRMRPSTERLQAEFSVDGEEIEARAGEIVVVPAGAVHAVRQFRRGRSPSAQPRLEATKVPGPPSRIGERPSRMYGGGVTRRSRVLAFGSAGMLVVAGAASAALLGGLTGQVLAIALISAGLGAAVLLAFLEVGLSEDRERARDEERRHQRAEGRREPWRPPSPPRRPRRPG